MNFPTSSPEYSHLRQRQDPMGIVYRFQSRRFGNSLGINVLGQTNKVCSYDCVYCELGSTKIKMNEVKKSSFFAPPDTIIASIRSGFETAKTSKQPVDAINFVGNGEPTLYPDLALIAAEVRSLRDLHFPGVSIGILTNGSHVHSKKVQKAFEYIDLKMMKFDAGSDKMLKVINAPLVKDSVEKLITNARKIKNVIIQSCFFQGRFDNTKPEHLDEWIEAIGMIRPDKVHLYTLDRIPPTPELIKADEDTLYTIVAKLEKRTRIKAKVFY